MMRILLLLLALMLPWTAVAEEAEYINPMTVEGQYAPISVGADDYGIGDPFVMRWNGMYYMYSSTCEDRVRVYTSRDLVNWEYQGYCTKGRDVHFAYAPEVVYWRGDFYMITSPNGGGHYILKSDDPLGPFELITENFGYAIDGSFFPLDDGQLMILFPDSNSIKTSVLDETTMLPFGKSATGATLHHWTEGPGLFRRGDWYYLTFTGNHVQSTGYQVAYASRRDGPQGAYIQQQDATLLIHSVFGDDWKGLGHSSNVIGPDLDSIYTAYHSLVSSTGPARLYNLDRLLTNGGLLYTTGPTHSAMPVPAMPDVYGDIAGDAHDFMVTEEGWFAEVEATQRFTQEWNYILTGGVAVLQIGELDGAPVLATVNETTLCLTAGDKMLVDVVLPYLGREGRLHTLRVEHTPDILYAYVDSMRVLTMDQPGLTAQRIGAFKQEGVSYGYLACTAEALGSSDDTALKVIPGGFSAIHALNRGELNSELSGSLEEAAPLLGEAQYQVRVVNEGAYCFDLTVRTVDAGKGISLMLDGESLWQGTIPVFDGQEEWFTFTTAPIALPGGDHLLAICAENVLLNRVESFAWAETQPLTIDFTDRELRSTFYTLGPFTMQPAEGLLRISPNRAGFAIFGEEGYTDLELSVRFRIPVSGSGNSGVLLRATNVSIYDAQVQESWFGYGLTLTKLGINLRRMRYGATGGMEFVSIPSWSDAEEAELFFRLEGSKISVSLPGEEAPLLVMDDADPFTHGLFGFFSTGKELEVLSLEVSPLE